MFSMRHRELIKRLKADWREIRKTQVTFCGNAATTQANEQRRQIVFHGLESLLPEIIEKLEAKP